MSSRGSKVYRCWIVSEARRKMKQRAVAYKGGKCERCGYDKSYAALEFHHRDPAQKDFSLASKHYRRWERVVVELDKCMLLCSNCHAEEHASLRQKRLSEQARQARLEVPSRVFLGDDSQPRQDKGIARTCPQCGKPFRVTPCRLAASPDPCRSETCAALRQQKADWPGDERLAKLVWEHPVREIASALGVSDVAVKKHCARRGIPTPGRGYWAQARAS